MQTYAYDSYIHHKKVQTIRITLTTVLSSGRIAEELLHGKDKVSTGAASDIENATSVAYSLVCKYGMSEKVGY